ncbi:MAG: prephenate dehydrogenase/arogenate dehydrogenase family protein [Acidimicrobiia bacterium]|nr:prephenate dehydrogenase/arogenate dehydrogenase family protein [bacterium]MXZ29407.1 prephenate dehydrogenase/arogenate dehydrogenase family protein [Acidimicrobiia bacterium]MYB25208.1 prephenate dehydrogenase/arogenate dehydrogenase family protein [Acidimicrobiia bacterium]MYE68148.1 prephenate dehydrogenase/arogenate dehydrogenase family protein [Acidimicrobiia bacterium]
MGLGAAVAEGGSVQIHGLGLIGGSIGLGLRAAGWWVTGTDIDELRARQALRLGAVNEIGRNAHADVTFVATPAAAIPELAREALESGDGVVTDVGSVKAPICESVQHPRFVGGHPMAGSEQAGIAGARPDMFGGAVWVLTPGPATLDETYAAVRAAVAELGAEAVTMPPDRHDALVSVVSHVPHLTAAVLMRLADERTAERTVLQRLAAGGFRDMTRVAAGSSDIWLDICAANRLAICASLERLIEALEEMRDVVQRGDRETLRALLERARVARLNLPSGIPSDVDLAVLRVPVKDRPGEVARIATLATEVDVNIYDLEIAHSAEGDRGVLIMVVAADLAERLRAALAADGYQSTMRLLGI